MDEMWKMAAGAGSNLEEDMKGKLVESFNVQVWGTVMSWRTGGTHECSCHTELHYFPAQSLDNFSLTAGIQHMKQK